MTLFLQNFIENLKFNTHHEELVTVKDLDFKYCYASPKMVMAHGFENLNQIIGKTIYETNSSVVSIAKELEEEDKICINSCQPTRNIFYGQYSTFNGFFLMERYPILCVDGKSHGVLIKIDKIKAPWAHIKIVGSLIKYPSNHKLKGFIQLKPILLKLTKREQVVLFLCILNYNLEDIALITSIIFEKQIGINLIRNTINQQLYLKFEVSSIVELVDKAIEYNYDKIIPEEMLRLFRNYSISRVNG